MTNNNKRVRKSVLRKALFSSAISLILCCAMLVGTTFAWFTDSVTSSNNIIKSGTLDVEMYWADGKTVPASATWTDASTGAIFNYDKWEPGYVDVKHIKVENKGTLALKYQLNIVANGEVSALSDVIDVYYSDPAEQIDDRNDLANKTSIGTLTNALAAMSSTASGSLKAGESDIVTIALKMQETAGNEYQNLSIGSDFSVQLLATQLTYEKDSFDDQYDKMATIDDEAELTAALAADYDLIQLGANVALTNSVIIPAGKVVAIDLAGYTMSQQSTSLTAAYAMIENNGTLTIKDSVGTGKLSYADMTPYTSDIGWASNTIKNLGTLNVYGGTIENTTPEAIMNYSYPHAIDAYQGSVTNIYGGTVKSANYDSIRMFCNSDTLATTVNITGGTIINRVSFQDPNANKSGYGRLNISGGNFITTDNVNANVRLLNFCKACNNMKANVTGGTFDKGFKTQDIVNAGVEEEDWLVGVKTSTTVNSAEALQNAINSATDDVLINLGADIKDDIVVPQTDGINIIIDGNGNTYTGSIIVDGKSAATPKAGFIIKNIVFKADNISADACINLGDGSDGTRYTTNVTVENCTFDVTGAVGVKSYTGGDKNLTITGCTATANAHSLVQIAGVNGVTVENCTINSKNGINVNQSDNVEIIGCTANVSGYAVRFGASSGTTGTAETYLIKNCTLKSACAEEGDAVIILRGTAESATLTIENTTITGTPDILNTANATVTNN